MASETTAVPGYEDRVRASFARMAVMRTLGIELGEIRPGEVTVTAAFRTELTQQHGSLHAGVVAALLDTACGYAAFSLMPVGSGVVSVEFKTNLLAPARTDLRTVGRVLRAGRTLSVCTATATGSDGTPVATMLATMMAVRTDEPPG